ncbi:hypothetical protein [Burkholderia anthina]|uniref:Lipoprotein n=1 Tax=Burkholderia anthina TaxID=179879 RepID=A0ABS2BCC5_9BURK|nr:hypothetical protein [Burkholderia anthina]MBM2770675.1 hypothetical protein [Burkholderia anthina]
MHEREIAIAPAFADRYTAARKLLSAICLIVIAVGGGPCLTRKITAPIGTSHSIKSTPCRRDFARPNICTSTIIHPACNAPAPSSAPYAHAAFAALRNFRSRPKNAMGSDCRIALACPLIPVMHF